MKAEIHPKTNYITAKCACGATYDTDSTASELKVTICANCHPFYTGQQKFIDTAGRIEKFNKKYEKKALKK
jgi:large subunit ribosomal protein L31